MCGDTSAHTPCFCHRPGGGGCRSRLCSGDAAAVSHLAPHPSPRRRWPSLLTQIKKVTPVQRTVNELILITVNRTFIRHVCPPPHVCSHVLEAERLNSRKGAFPLLSPPGQQSGLFNCLHRQSLDFTFPTGKHFIIRWEFGFENLWSHV